MNQGRTIIIYDHECELCKRFKLALERMDHQNLFGFLSAREDTTFDLFPNLNQDDCLETLHLLDPDRNILCAGEAINYILQSLPEAKKYLWLLDTKAGKKATDLFYKTIDTFRKSSLHSCGKCGK